MDDDQRRNYNKEYYRKNRDKIRLRYVKGKYQPIKKNKKDKVKNTFHVVYGDFILSFD
jgi:heterodisulfide reductase subunit A-like polyferredoxin